MTLRELSIEQFTEALASSAATPGGGSAAALSGALAAALVAMVARNTAANPSFADRAAAMDEIAQEAERYRAELIALVDEDAASFEQVMTAFRLPKETPEQKEERSRQIQAGYQAAAEPPLRVCRHALEVLALARRAAELGNPHVVSDAGVAALLAVSALDGAALNVEINLASINDETFKYESEWAVRRARRDGETLRDAALAATEGVLR